MFPRMDRLPGIENLSRMYAARQHRLRRGKNLFGKRCAVSEPIAKFTERIVTHGPDAAVGLGKEAVHFSFSANSQFEMAETLVDPCLP